VKKAPDITLRSMRRTTPTLWANMRLCRLRAVLSSTREADAWVLQNPSAWLGTAFHRLMAQAPTSDQEAESLWSATIDRLADAAAVHPLNRRFASPERWPGYFLIRQRAIASAVQPRTAGAWGPVRSSSGQAGNERLIEARGGRLAGKPDRYDSRSITEYKSSLPDPTWEEAPSIIDGFWRQLRLYAVLVAEEGSWPAVLRIVAASGQSLERQVDRRECEAEADAAVCDLEATNNLLARADDHSLATPSEVACAQCPYQAICPAFWAWAAKSRWPKLRRQAARGEIVGVDHGSDGDLYSLTLQLDGRFGAEGPQPLALRRSVQGDFSGRRLGSGVRVTQALLRPDGRLRADILTCVAAEDSVPRLVPEVTTP